MLTYLEYLTTWSSLTLQRRSIARPCSEQSRVHNSLRKCSRFVKRHLRRMDLIVDYLPRVSARWYSLDSMMMNSRSVILASTNSQLHSRPGSRLNRPNIPFCFVSTDVRGRTWPFASSVKWTNARYATSSRRR